MDHMTRSLLVEVNDLLSKVTDKTLILLWRGMNVTLPQTDHSLTTRI